MAFQKSVRLALTRIAVRILVPLVVLWARQQESLITRTGVSLSPAQAEAARRLRIVRPDRVRLLAVERVPPLNPFFQWAAKKLGIHVPEVIGMALRYGIFIRADYQLDLRVAVHELVHVAQYERLGGFRSFIAQYLDECVHPGYPFGKLEKEAAQIEAAYLCSRD